MSDARWQFWIDVGGTFTDCVAHTPDGLILRRKVLSSGSVKETIAIVSENGIIASSSQPGDQIADFWHGYQLRLLDRQGKIEAEAIILGSESIGERQVRLVSSVASQARPGQAVEILSPESAPLLAIRSYLGLRLNDHIPACAVRLGTTRGTNALLTRRGARVGFVTTRGFADVLRIGYQDRPKLFDLVIRKPAPLYERVIEVDERIAADGSVLVAVDEPAALKQLQALRGQGIESLAICLMNSFVQPVHELVVERLAREAGFDEISVSHRVSPLMKIVPRGDTTVLDAYLTPVLRRYVEQLKASLPGSGLRVMTSAGGLLLPEAFTGKDSVLSGPAGGVVGFSRAARSAGFSRAIGFDMGGTSTDVSRFDGKYEYEFETSKASIRIATPLLAIETVAAGGGSLCRFDGVKLIVGPESAGADPGPACYGRGGPLTVTDCNLLLGRLPAERFPFSLVESAVQDRLQTVADEIEASGAQRPTFYELAEGFLQIANTHMAAAVRSISIAKGYNPRDYVLVPFGAAGPQHACAVAQELGIRQILIPPGAGVLSAEGIGQAQIRKIITAAVYQPYEEFRATNLGTTFSRLEQQAREAVTAEGIESRAVTTTRSLDLRYRGVDATLTIDQPGDGNYTIAFEQAHKQRYGYLQPDRALEIVAARVEAASAENESVRPSPPKALRVVSARDRRQVVMDGREQSVGLFDGDALFAESTASATVIRIKGPALLVDSLTTTVIEQGWEATIDARGYVLTDTNHKPGPLRDASAVDAADSVLLEVFNSHFTAIATQMGIALRNTASSVNVKERLDFSCALFTADGDLVVNAPHIPVHLGAMSDSVKQIIADNPQMHPGDVFVTNDPYRGGSHLPDVTVVTPVFIDPEAQRGESGREPTGDLRPSFFTANRAHHAEIGGISPGSMPPFSRNLAEEGVLLRNFKLVDAGNSRLEELDEVLRSGPWPSRAVQDNLADVTAQIAANQSGADDIRRHVERYSLPAVQGFMRSIQAAAEKKMRAALARLKPGKRMFTDYLDDGTPICVAIDVQGDSATIDFTGTGEVLASNLNANRSIVTAAVLYCLRLLIDEEIPLNQGVLAPITIVLPQCLLNPPAGVTPDKCAAVVGGNVETSQRVVDVLLGALGIAAASHGTMNNVLFGDQSFGYYETICGGSGATAISPGTDAVHTHMTNTRLTDPEVLERRFPVRVREFAIRRGSGGAGEYPGGDGVRRSLEFLRPVKLSLLTQRRGPYPPYGIAGGESGALGRNSIQRADGSLELLLGQVQIEAQAGDVLTVETPGGGGWGPPPST